MKNFNIIVILIILCISTQCYATEEDDYCDDDIECDNVIVPDPFERINRHIFNINNKLDNNIIIPLVETYRKVLPKIWLRKRVEDFFINLYEPSYIVNNLLQKNMRGFFVSIFRFLVNSTVGFLGLFDISSKLGVNGAPEDFSSTMYNWNMPAGPYIIMPVIGPSNPRNIIGKGADIMFDPMSMALPPFWIPLRLFMDLIIKKNQYLSITQNVSQFSIDDYAMIRSLYYQTIYAQNKQ